MFPEFDTSNRRIPSLVHLCQRVAVAYVDGISNLGPDLSYPLVKPILERCSPEQLLRLEQSSPRLKKDTPEIWKDLCMQKYSLAMERFMKSQDSVPQSWRDHFFSLREEEAKRLEEASTKLRNQRLEAEERKKEREVKFTDRVPPPKRARTGWSNSIQPKTLFQKTRSEASKIQRNMLTARMLPPMLPNGKTYNVLPKPSNSAAPLLPGTGDSSRITVNTVVHRRPQNVSTPLSGQGSSKLSSSAVQKPATSKVLPSDATSMPTPTFKKPPESNSPVPSSKLQSSAKKDPMACLFVPKQRAYSQRPP